MLGNPSTTDPRHDRSAQDRRGHDRHRRPDARHRPPRQGGRAHAGARLRRAEGRGARRHGAAIRARKQPILAANAEDVADAKAAGATAAFLDRLALDDKRVAAMADGLDVVRALPDPVGAVTESWTRPNGMTIERVRVPLGVVGIIYESRPNVTADAGALCLKAGNAVILRGGSESFHSNRAIHAALRRGAARRRLCRKPRSSWCRRATAPRSGSCCRASAAAIDVIVPRGGKEPGRARAGRSARAGVRASRRHLPRLCRPGGEARHGARRSCSTPRCGAPASAARPRRCWSTARSRRPISSRSSACCSMPAARCAATRRRGRSTRA